MSTLRKLEDCFDFVTYDQMGKVNRGVLVVYRSAEGNVHTCHLDHQDISPFERMSDDVVAIEQLCEQDPNRLIFVQPIQTDSDMEHAIVRFCESLDDLTLLFIGGEGVRLDLRKSSVSEVASIKEFLSELLLD